MTRLAAVVAVVSCLVASMAPGVAQADPRSPTQAKGESSRNVLPTALENVGIEDKTGGLVPLDVKLTGSDGRSFVLGEFLKDDRPLVVVLAYYSCPMLCSLVLNGLNDGIKQLKETVGDEYRVLVVSFDPRDTTKVAHDKLANYVAAYGREINGHGYEMATGAEADVRRLADALGFRYNWDEASNQYAHAAGLFVISPKGKLSHVITGIRFPADQLSTALTDARNEVSHSPLSSVFYACFMYDPKRGSYVPVVRNVMKLGGAATLLGLVGFVAVLARKDRRRRQRAALTPAGLPPTTDSAGPSHPTSGDLSSPSKDSP